MSRLAVTGVVCIVVAVLCAVALFVRWRNGRRAAIEWAKNRHPSNRNRVDAMVADTYDSTDAMFSRVAEHFGTTERVLYPKPVEPTVGRRVSGDPAYGCEVRWEKELFADSDFTIAARYFGVRQESR
jgi:hypothetical protein